jgi:hypothetical protein
MSQRRSGPGALAEIAVEQDGGHHRNQAGQSSAEVLHGLRVRELKLRYADNSGGHDDLQLAIRTAGRPLMPRARAAP